MMKSNSTSGVGGSTTSSTSSSSSSSSSTSSRLAAPAKQDLSPINYDSERELQRQFEDIANEFKMKDSRDWSYRYKALIQLQKILAGNAIEFKSFMPQLRALSPGLVEQVTELRSTIVKEACAAVTLAATRLKARFEPLALLYVQALLKVVIVKVAIIAEAAHSTLKAILSSVPTKGLLASILIASGDQHNESLRRRACDYLLQILGRAIEEPGMVLMSSVPSVESSISKLLVDGGSDIRVNARLCFWAYLELSEERALAMLYDYTSTTQKNLFSMVDTLPQSQKDLATKIQQSILQEDQDQLLVGESTDLDFDMSDFKKEPVQSTQPTTQPTTRAKTPTSSSTIPSGRQSGLKGRVPTGTSSTTTTSSTSTSSIPQRRSGSSLGMTAPSIPRSKSSLGINKSTGSSSSSTSSSSPSISSKASSSSPNVSSSNLSGRYSSIGSRISQPSPASGKSSLAQTLKTSQTKAAAISSYQQKQQQPPPSLTKSKSNPSLTSSTSSTTTTTASSSSTAPPKPIGRSVSSPTTGTLLKKSAATPPSTSTTTTTTTTTTATSLSRSAISPTSNTKVPASTQLSKSTIETSSASSSSSRTLEALTQRVKALNDAPPTAKKTSRKSIEINDGNQVINEAELLLNRSVGDIGDVEDLIQYSNTLVESLANIESEIDSLNPDSSQFKEISDALEDNLLDAKRGLSLIDDDVGNELRLEDLELDDIVTGGGGNGADGVVDISSNGVKPIGSNNNNNKRQSTKLKRNNSNENFNWIEDSVDQGLIEDDLLDFDDDDDLINNDRHNLIVAEDSNEFGKANGVGGGGSILDTLESS
ncbi:hypothetical protein SAMD00019534_112870 [Acytostelium subglobosum LB1]|uniref:hypothetical protein n=1 Tax=Acytostelium subglobosum LB1 TaxID=1410327 RepID=UPI00064515FD|nr:hypothetical protein SAMD00019534_112870 [Acytostelium subglobosum LB1]GAM28111.1 hypothetical protein SAMD00019534_112870 [Acytostelium subglobosum LB1]|eukprot:XP_012749070.1 hypothetical protein SAMD00019534_112870 [Acytostelium subglobosum LB1]